MHIEFFFTKLSLAKKLHKSKEDLSVIYSSIAQTCQDLHRYEDALKYFELEIKTFCANEESVKNS
jgi:predicted DNA-binding protein YlxM (UPF0122 family)